MKTTLTPPEIALDIQAIDRRINEKLKSLRGIVETFLKNPEPPTWVPPAVVTQDDRNFYAQLQIPCYSNRAPSILFHKLDDCNDEEIEMIFGRDNRPYVIINCAVL